LRDKKQNHKKMVTGKLMKSFHVDTELTWRGGERQVLLLLKGLSARGHQAFLAGRPGGEILRRVRTEGLPHLALNMFGPLDIFAAKKIARFCRDHDIPIVHLHTAHACALGPWIRRFYPSIRLVASRRVDFPIRSARKYRKMDAVIAVSDKIRDILKASGIPEEKIRLIHSGVPLPDLPVKKDQALRASLGLEGAYPVVGNIAHLAGHKGHVFLLEAAEKLRRRLPGARYLIVGEGEERRSLETRVRRSALSGQVIFTGFRKDALRLMGLFDIFVLPSRLEGLGTSLLDAMSHGIPVAASRTGGIPDIIDHGENGLLVPPSDPEALAGAIEKLAGDRGLRQRFGEKGRRTVESRFSIDGTVEKIISLYDLIGDRH
jgi:glycosyltransferase involved in cell wall biosynthesis